MARCLFVPVVRNPLPTFPDVGHPSKVGLHVLNERLFDWRSIDAESSVSQQMVRWFGLPNDVRMLVLHALIGVAEGMVDAVRALHRLSGTCRWVRHAVLTNSQLWEAVRHHWCRPMPAGRPQRIFEDLCALHARVQRLAPGLLMKQSADTGLVLAANRHAGRETAPLLLIKLEVAAECQRRCEQFVRQLNTYRKPLMASYGSDWFDKLARAYVTTRHLPRWNQPGTASCKAADLACMLRWVEQAYPCFVGGRLYIGWVP